MTGLERIEAAKASREAKGLKIEWNVPAPESETGTRYFSAYASSDEIKAKMIANGEKRGWKLI